MTLTRPISFLEALRREAVRRLMPTTLGSAELQQLNGDILRGSLFSARTTLEPYLQRIRTVVRKILNPVVVTRPDGRQVTDGMDVATARLTLKQELQRLGYRPDPEKRGTIEDLSSDRRIELVIRTNRDIAQGYGQYVQGQDPDVLDAFPAAELYRAEDRGVERNWGRRWLAAARSAGDRQAVRVFGETSRMIARKDSGIWQALGDGAGGFESDALHNPYPPFAFNSGMDVRDVPRSRAVQLGLLGLSDRVRPTEQEFPFATAA